MKAIKWYIATGGYLATKVYNPDTRRWHTVLQHRLIWETQHGPIPKGAVIHHKNGIPSDNRIENLELLPSTGAHISRHRTQEKTMGVVKNCPFCAKEFVAFNQKKYCNQRCRYAAAMRRWHQRNPGVTAARARSYRAKRKAA